MPANKEKFVRTFDAISPQGSTISISEYVSLIKRGTLVTGQTYTEGLSSFVLTKDLSGVNFKKGMNGYQPIAENTIYFENNN